MEVCMKWGSCRLRRSFPGCSLALSLVLMAVSGCCWVSFHRCLLPFAGDTYCLWSSDPVPRQIVVLSLRRIPLALA